MEENPIFKCLNPDCRHEWRLKGWMVKNLRCPKCHRSYVLDKDLFTEVVTNCRRLLEHVDHEILRAEIYGKGDVIMRIFPQIRFNPFQVIYEEALSIKGGLK